MAGATVDADRCAHAVRDVVELARMADGATDVEHGFAGVSVVAGGEAHRQFGVIALHLGVFENEAVGAHEAGVGEAAGAPGALQVLHPVIAQVAQIGALGRVIEGFAIGGTWRSAPALGAGIVHLVRRSHRDDGVFKVAHEADEAADDEHEQGQRGVGHALPPEPGDVAYEVRDEAEDRL